MHERENLAEENEVILSEGEFSEHVPAAMASNSL